MSFMDKLKKTAAYFAHPIKNGNFNQMQQERYNRNPMSNPNLNPNAPEDELGMQTINVPVKVRQSRIIVKKGLLHTPDELKPEGYVTRLHYPLLPVRVEKKIFEEKRRIRNSHNVF